MIQLILAVVVLLGLQGLTLHLLSNERRRSKAAETAVRHAEAQAAKSAKEVHRMQTRLKTLLTTTQTRRQEAKRNEAEVQSTPNDGLVDRANTLFGVRESADRPDPAA